MEELKKAIDKYKLRELFGDKHNIKQIILDISMFNDKDIEREIVEDGGLKLFGIPVKHKFLDGKKFEILEE
ncbi:hypothetical protein [Clostridium sp. HBUAS56017]|uniref:hypothetical protein n=1 Tax=Clostridium sp. HBUAS56017 TaxID=2571128 RepID=UPI001178AC31|nr:hypothetical protein [Clostridium sp. HBUAS56017]